MWANVQHDDRPAEYRWRPLFNAAVWLTPATRVLCSNAAKTRNPFVSDIAIFVLKRDVKLQLTNAKPAEIGTPN